MSSIGSGSVEKDHLAQGQSRDLSIGASQCYSEHSHHMLLCAAATKSTLRQESAYSRLVCLTLGARGRNKNVGLRGRTVLTRTSSHENKYAQQQMLVHTNRRLHRADHDSPS